MNLDTAFLNIYETVLNCDDSVLMCIGSIESTSHGLHILEADSVRRCGSQMPATGVELSYSWKR